MAITRDTHGNMSPEHATPMVNINGSKCAWDRKGNMEPVMAQFWCSCGHENIFLPLVGWFFKAHMFRRRGWNIAIRMELTLGKNSGCELLFERITNTHRQKANQLGVCCYFSPALIG